MSYEENNRYQYQNLFTKAYRRIRYFPAYLYEIFGSIIREYIDGDIARQNKEILADRIAFYKKHNKPVPSNVVYERPFRTIMRHAKAIYDVNVEYWYTTEEVIQELSKRHENP